MRISRILFGLGFIALAIVMILNIAGVTFGLPESISVWQILFGGFCFLWFVNNLIKLRFSRIFFPLIFIVMLFEKEIAGLMGIENGNITSAWGFLLIALLLTIGSSLLIPKHWRHRAYRKIMFNKKSKYSGGSVHYIDCSLNLAERIENNLGNCEVFFTNTEMYNGSGSVSLENNLGRVTMHVPQDWYVISRVENNLGSVVIPHKKEKEGSKRLDVIGENNMGNITVIFI